MRLAATTAMAILAGPVAAQDVCLCLRCVGPGFDRYAAPSASMKPTVEPGQCAIMATDLPETFAPGTVVTFRSAPDMPVLLSRVIATEGQEIALVDGRVVIDDVPVETRPATPYVQHMRLEGTLGVLHRCPPLTPFGESCEIARFTETIGGTSFDVLDLGPFPQDDFGPVTVPPGHVFVMQDNRDNSSDSRMEPPYGPGMVPVTAILGVLDEIR